MPLTISSARDASTHRATFEANRCPDGSATTNGFPLESLLVEDRTDAWAVAPETIDTTSRSALPKSSTDSQMLFKRRRLFIIPASFRFSRICLHVSGPIRIHGDHSASVDFLMAPMFDPLTTQRVMTQFV